MPFLLPPPEFRPGELTQMGLTGTCEMQICRSAGPWSLGTPDRIEHSIQNAYLKGWSYICPCFTRTDTLVIFSYSDVGALRIHRKPVLHYIVSLLFAEGSPLSQLVKDCRERRQGREQDWRRACASYNTRSSGPHTLEVLHRDSIATRLCLPCRPW